MPNTAVATLVVAAVGLLVIVMVATVVVMVVMVVARRRCAHERNGVRGDFRLSRRGGCRAATARPQRGEQEHGNDGGEKTLHLGMIITGLGEGLSSARRP